MEFISNCTADAISNAAKALKDGHLVAFPTETVYGLGADAANEKAVSRIYSVKGRPTNHPLIVHISSINKLEDWATDIPDYAIKLAREFWPGPMTLILPRKEIANDFITGGQGNVGLRVPDQPIALALLKKFEEIGGQGVAAPSANRFGAVSATTTEAVIEELGDYLNSDDLVLDGGQCSVGIESTIIDCSTIKPKILRPGMLSNEFIESIASTKIVPKKLNESIKFSGSFKRHYAPKAKIRINELAREGDGFIALSNVRTPNDSIRLISPTNMNEFARDLYSAFRLADRLGLKAIAVILPDAKVNYAILDRLQKAAYEER